MLVMKAVRGHTDIPALCHEYSQEEENKQRDGSAPSVSQEWRGLVEVCLIELYYD